jgi:nitrite reductase/ring-hydroxylating ferredoxin subunit/uncharacterized membrane protein
VRPLFRGLAEGFESMEALDPIAAPVRDLVQRVVPNESQAKDLLSGTWLGHPLHPLLTDVTIGAWLSASMLDVLGGRGGEGAARRLTGLGILSALPTAAAGLSDWVDGGPKIRRVGIVHAAANVTGLLLQILSWRSRRKGHRARGRAWGMLGMGVTTGSAYLGGHLSFGRGMGVNQTAFEVAPKSWKKVMDAEALPEGKLVRGSVSGPGGAIGLVLYRQDEQVRVLSDRCSHMGCSLSDGEVRGGDAVTCPCHGSTFSFEDGSILRGPATAPQPAFEARIAGGKVEVRSPP